jgi:hypothetical protein
MSMRGDPRPTRGGPELAAWEARQRTQYPVLFVGREAQAEPPGVDDASARDAIESAAIGSEFTSPHDGVWAKTAQGWIPKTTTGQ